MPHKSCRASLCFSYQVTHSPEIGNTLSVLCHRTRARAITLSLFSLEGSSKEQTKSRIEANETAYFVYLVEQSSRFLPWPLGGF